MKENINVVATYDYYTLDQARDIIYAEMRHNRAVRKWKAKQKAEQKRKERERKLIQRISGIMLVVIGIVIPNLLCGDATFSLIALPLGIWLLFTKEKVMMF